MSDSFVSCHIHYIFSTKERIEMIPSNIQPRLWAYIGGVARQNGMCALMVGGTSKHVHILLSMPSTISIAKGAQLIKTLSQSSHISWKSLVFRIC